MSLRVEASHERLVVRIRSNRSPYRAYRPNDKKSEPQSEYTYKHGNNKHDDATEDRRIEQPKGAKEHPEQYGDAHTLGSANDHHRVGGDGSCAGAGAKSFRFPRSGSRDPWRWHVSRFGLTHVDSALCTPNIIQPQRGAASLANGVRFLLLGNWRKRWCGQIYRQWFDGHRFTLDSACASCDVDCNPVLLRHLIREASQKWPRLSEQHSPIYKWTAGGLPKVQSCPRRRWSLATNRPTRWATRGAPELASYAASFIVGKWA